MRNAAHEKPVRRVLAREQRQRLLIKRRHQLGRLLGLGRFRVHRPDRRDREPLAPRIRVGQRAFEPLAPEHHHKPVLLAR